MKQPYPPNQDFQLIYKKVLKAHRKFFTKRIIDNLADFLIPLFLVIGFFLLINLLFYVDPVLRIVFLILLVIFLFLFVFIKIIPHFREIIKPTETEIYKTAKKIGNADKDVQDAIINYMQIHLQSEDETSKVLKRLALQQLYTRIFHYDFSHEFNRPSFFLFSRNLLSGIIIMVILFIIFPSQMIQVFQSIFVPWKKFHDPLPITLFNESGNINVLKDDPVNLNGHYNGTTPDQIYLIIEDLSEPEQENDVNEIGKIVLSQSPGNRYQYLIDHVRNTFQYYFAAEINQPRFRGRMALSESGMVSVNKRPNIRHLQLKIVPPKYTALPAKLLSPNEGDVAALRGSKIVFQIEVDKQLASAEVIFGDSSKISLQPRGHTASGDFILSKNITYYFRILDTAQIPNSNPIIYTIYAVNDDYPYAEIKQPGEDVDLQDDLTLPIFIEIRDDYGFTELWLKGTVYRVASGEDTTNFAMKLPYNLLEKGKAFSERVWNLTPIYMVPDDYLTYYAEVFDNDLINGPKSYRTSTYTIRLPSLFDILAENEESRDQQLEDIRNIGEEAEKLKEELKEISRELKKETKLNWEQEQQLKQNLSRQEELSKRLSEVRENLDQMIENMDQNRVLSPETLEKYFELQKMIQELNSPELREAIEKLNEALEKADIQQIQNAIERFQFSVEEFERSIERLHELFQQVHLEQMMDELIKIAEKIQQEQNQINEKLQNNDLTSQDFHLLQKMEENVENNLQLLKDRMYATQREFESVSKEQAEKFDEVDNYINKSQLSDKINQIKDYLENQDQRTALSQGREAKSELDMVLNMLQNMKMEMMQQQKQNLTRQMQKTMQDLLNASFEQEKLANKSENLSNASAQINDLARDQARLLMNARQLISQIMEISNQTFLLPPQINQQMASAFNNMESSIESLENRNLGRAANFQKKSMASFNQVILSLQSSMNQLAQASSASGFQEYMEMLQQIAALQGNLNQESMALFQKSQQGRLQLSEGDLARLAAQQDLIRRSLEDLANEMGSRRDVLGRLDELGDEMNEIVKDFEAQRFDRKIIERQKQILSRMLDAQKSIREREYSRKREAERETIHYAKSPPELKEELLRKEDLLKKYLIEALEEGYALEYKELIKKYFESLSQQSNFNQ
jgi:hypothetical protein